MRFPTNKRVSKGKREKKSKKKKAVKSKIAKINPGHIQIFQTYLNLLRAITFFLGLSEQ